MTGSLRPAEGEGEPKKLDKRGEKEESKQTEGKKQEQKPKKPIDWGKGQKTENQNQCSISFWCSL